MQESKQTQCNGPVKKIIEMINAFSPHEMPIEFIDTLDFKELAIDSISYISLIVEIEEEFNITFDDESLFPSTFKSISEFILYVVKSAGLEPMIHEDYIEHKTGEL